MRLQDISGVWEIEIINYNEGYDKSSKNLNDNSIFMEYSGTLPGTLGSLSHLIHGVLRE